MSTWTLFFAALGVAMFLEGAPYFVAPRAMRRFLELVQGMSDAGLRWSGLALMTTGLLVAYVATR